MPGSSVRVPAGASPIRRRDRIPGTIHLLRVADGERTFIEWR